MDQTVSAGVEMMAVCGSTESDWEAVTALFESYPDRVIPFYGLHPWYIAERSSTWTTRLEAIVSEQHAGIGEIGLDRWKDDLPWDGQEEVFVAQLRLAAARNVPVHIHCLRAWGRMLELLKREPRPDTGFLLHSYGGSTEMVDQFAALGAYFSFPGAFAREGRRRSLDAFRHVPPDRLLLETDAPDQMPPSKLIHYPLTDGEGHSLNHPANLPSIYAWLAHELSEPLETLARRVEQNFHRLFRPLLTAKSANGH